MVRKYKAWIIGAVVLLAVVVGLAFALRPKPQPVADGTGKLHGKRNLMIMGVDKRSGDAGRSDTLMVAMVDPGKDKLSLLSVPRDTLVSIPGHGWDKINHAYAYGGHQLSQITLENFLGLQISHYILVDFQGFVKLVDAIGGVDIDVEKDMQYTDPYDGETGLVISLHAGRQHLDGTTAIQYVRYRDEEGDIGRVKRQQKFMKAVFQKLSGTNLLTRAPEIARTLYQSIDTDLSVTDLASLLMTFARNVSGESRLETEMVQGSPAYLDDISYWIPDMEALGRQVARMQGVKTGSGYTLAARRAKEKYDQLLGVNSTAEPSKVREIRIQNDQLKKSVEQSRKLDLKRKGLPPAGQAGSSGAGSSSSLPPAPKQRPLQATIVNCSGSSQTGAQAAADARNAGFVVLSITTGNPMDQTQVLINSGSSRAEERVGSLPFNYTLLRGSVNPGSGDAVIYVGKDYGK